jgi:hypothetical protein
MFVLRNIVARGHRARPVGAVRATTRPEQVHRLITAEIGALAAALGSEGLERVRLAVLAQPASDASPTRMTRRDLRGAVGVFLLVFLSTFPVVLPFVFIADPGGSRRPWRSPCSSLVVLPGAGMPA